MTDKLFYRMRDVCEMTGLEPHVLRFWESEFPQLKPGKNRAGHRIFKEQDILVVKQIKTLLHEEGFTISGAQKKLASLEDKSSKSSVQGGAAGALDPRRELAEVKGILKKVINLLDSE